MLGRIRLQDSNLLLYKFPKQPQMVLITILVFLNYLYKIREYNWLGNFWQGQDGHSCLNWGKSCN